MEEDDHLIRHMKLHGIPLTRENYIDLAYGKDVPEWGAELESELPKRFQHQD